MCRACWQPVRSDPVKVGRWTWHRECWNYARPRRSMIRWPDGATALADMRREN